jgi:hypothetical protein
MSSFLDALKHRYGAADTTEYDDDAFLVSTTKSKLRQKKWEMVGLEETRVKQADHSKLTVVSLPDADIATAESVDGEIKAARLLRVRDLDLSRNTKLTLPAIETIVSHLPALSELQLNEIPLSSFAVTDKWKYMRTLTLNGTGLRWSCVNALEGLPRLNELHFESNGLAEIPADGTVLPTVTVLNLASNKINSWSFDSCLARQFPSLKELRLHGNDLTIPEHSVAVLSRLESLWLSGNDRLRGLEALAWLTSQAPQLKSLRVSYGTMLPGLSEAQARMSVIASIPTMLSLNNGVVRPKERGDAELFYLQRALRTEDVGGSRTIKFPRWEELQEKYKAVVTTGDGAESGQVSIMLNLTFRSLGNQDAVKTLPSSLTIGKVKSVVTAIWKDMHPDKQRLVFSCSSELGAAPAQPLDDDMQTLAHFGVGTGSIIEVLEVTVKS